VLDVLVAEPRLQCPGVADMCSANRRVRFSSNSDRESEFPQAVESCRPKRRSH